MSLILDALKKAEKSRVDAPALSAEKPVFSPMAAPETESRLQIFLAKIPKIPKKYLLISLAVVIGALGAYLGRGLVSRFLPGNKTVATSDAQNTDPNTTTVSKEDQINQLKEEAIKAYKDGNFDLSKQGWEKLVVLSPTDSEFYNNLGVVQKNMGNKDLASESYRTALSLNPNYAEALNNLGVIMLEKLLNDEAQQLFEKAIQVNAQYADPYFHLALILEDKKDIQGALEKYQAYLNMAKDIDAQLRSRLEMRMVTLQNF